MARSVLADGRALDAARMIEPLIESGGKPLGTGDVLLRCLSARIRLLSRGDVEGVFEILGTFEILSNRRALEAAVQAEAALWLGWAHVWHDGPHYDDARALNLLDEAAGIFRNEMNASGLCWTLIAQAHAYLAIDEYPLMLQAIDEASELRESINDVQASIWVTDVAIMGARYGGRYDTGEQYVARMLSLARTCEDELSVGRAHAHQAVLAYELGQPPSKIISEARHAESIFSRAGGRSERALLEAYDAHVGALVRQGAWEEAEKLTDTGSTPTGHAGTGASSVLLHRVRIHIYRGDLDRAENALENLRYSAPRHSRLFSLRVAHEYSELMLRRKQFEAATEWADRAYRLARETGCEANLLRALLQLARVAVTSGDAVEARRYLREMEPYGRYFNLLPIAAEQFDVQSRLALLRKRPEEARTFLTQAISTWSMIGDVYGTAMSQYELARLTRTSAPIECRTLAEKSLQIFERLGSRREVRRLRDLVRALPGHDGGSEQLSETEIAAVLTRSALSIELVAETWLRLAERIAPDRWMGVFRYEDRSGWNAVRTHGEEMPGLRFPDPLADRLCEEGVDWIRLKTVPSSAFFFAMACGGEDDPACRVIENRLSAWVPVAGLAFEHALLRGTSTAAVNGSRLPESERHHALDGLVYAGDAMRAVVDKINRIRSSHSPVLITGESGVGKNLVASCIHQTSDRSSAPFIEFNCGTASRKSFELELFGRTGSENGVDIVEIPPRSFASPCGGALGEAHGGTLFLDAIDEMPSDVQLGLLNFLERGEISRADADEPIKVNVRIIASTTRDLQDLITRGHFQEDLFLRLNVVPLRIPPLRQRRNEIHLLVKHFLRILQADRVPRATLSGRALEAMLRYDWPGNVRQLRNEIESAIVFTQSEPAPVIDVDDLSEPVAAALSESPERVDVPDVLTGTAFDGQALDDILASAEKSVIERALARHDGQVSAAADTLGLTRQGLYKKMKRLGIEASRFQSDIDVKTAVQ